MLRGGEWDLHEQALVDGIVASSGGHIWLYSDVGIGPTFKIYLSRHERQRKAVAASPAVAWEQKAEKRFT